jgi:hypothetical protein
LFQLRAVRRNYLEPGPTPMPADIVVVDDDDDYAAPDPTSSASSWNPVPPQLEATAASSSNPAEVPPQLEATAASSSNPAEVSPQLGAITVQQFDTLTRAFAANSASTASILGSLSGVCASIDAAANAVRLASTTTTRGDGRRGVNSGWSERKRLRAQAHSLGTSSHPQLIPVTMCFTCRVNQPGTYCTTTCCRLCCKAPCCPQHSGWG